MLWIPLVYIVVESFLSTLTHTCIKWRHLKDGRALGAKGAQTAPGFGLNFTISSSVQPHDHRDGITSRSEPDLPAYNSQMIFLSNFIAKKNIKNTKSLKVSAGNRSHISEGKFVFSKLCVLGSQRLF